MNVDLRVNCIRNNNHDCPTAEAGPVYNSAGICTECVNVSCIVL